MGKQQRAKLTRRNAQLSYRMYKAVSILTNNISAKELERLDRNLELLRQTKIEKIESVLPALQIATRDLCKRYGVKGTLEELEQATSFPEDDKPLVFVKKSDLEQLFTHYELRVPLFPKLPPHARIGIERYDTDDKDKIEIFILEASLFEDMAALWNTTLEIHGALSSVFRKEKKKQLSALLRATAKAAFNLIEGYLNSLSLDIQLTRTVTDLEKNLLTEWDSAKSKPRFLTLRDKLLQYPKIAIQADHPPLTESNCSEIGMIVELENRLRHSLIHPSPQESMKDPSIFREQLYMNLEIDEVAKLCDLATGLICRIDTVIKHKFGETDQWLFKRDATGYFPSESFN